MKKIILGMAVMVAILFGGDFEEAAKEAKAKNYTKAIKLYENASNQGNPKAPFYLGMFYLMGMGVEKDAEKAISLWHKSAELGYVEAQNTLGLMYRDQFKDYSKALKFFEQGTKQGSPKSEFLLGHMYAEGMGVKQDYIKASELYEKSAVQGYTLAQNNLGLMYMNGLGVEKNDNKAFILFQKASVSDSNAKTNLDIICQRSPSVCK